MGRVNEDGMGWDGKGGGEWRGEEKRAWNGQGKWAGRSWLGGGRGTGMEEREGRM